MDLLINVGISALLDIVRNKKDIAKWKAALAKVYVKIHVASTLDAGLAAAIAQARAKEGLQ